MKKINLLFALLIFSGLLAAQHGTFTASVGVGAAQSVKTPFVAASGAYSQDFEALRVEGSASALYADCSGAEITVGGAAGITGGSAFALPGLALVYSAADGRFYMAQSFRAGFNVSERLQISVAARFDQRGEWRSGLFFGLIFPKK